MPLRIDAALDFSAMDEVLDSRGLRPGGKVQAFIDSEVIRLSDPYVPFRTGALKDSALTNTVIGQGEVVYATPYAARCWYNPQFNFNGSPMRGAFWAERMYADKGPEIVRAAALLAGGTAE